MVSLAKIQDVILRYAQRVIDFILPYRCAASGQIVTSAGALSPEVWRQVDFINDPYCDCCGMPFDFLVEATTVCEQCIAVPPVYDSARSAIIYNDAAKSMILGFKHADKLHAVKTFTPWLLRCGADMIRRADYIIPVPLHYWRMVQRRYNQAGILARDLSKETNIPVIYDGLIRARNTKSQGHLSPLERQANVAGAFKPSPQLKCKIAGKTVILIDDVYTTGATVGECSKIILENGAAALHILTVAKALKK